MFLDYFQCSMKLCVSDFMRNVRTCAIVDIKYVSPKLCHLITGSQLQGTRFRFAHGFKDPGSKIVLGHVTQYGNPYLIFIIMHSKWGNWWFLAAMLVLHFSCWLSMRLVKRYDTLKLTIKQLIVAVHKPLYMWYCVFCSWYGVGLYDTISKTCCCTSLLNHGWHLLIGNNNQSWQNHYIIGEPVFGQFGTFRPCFIFTVFSAFPDFD